MAADIPPAVRAQVRERDGHYCRCCAQWCQHPHLHHITYRSQGGQHVLGNLISLCPTCHSRRAHGADNRRWQSLFAQVIELPGVNALALARWQG